MERSRRAKARETKAQPEGGGRGRLVLIGTGFLGITMVWQLYSALLPLYYGDLVHLGWVVGLIMGASNLLGKLVQPWVGAMSDATNSPRGRRVPFLLVGTPVAAVALVLLPSAHRWGLVPLVLLATVLNLAMAVCQSPTIALMPDVTPSARRSTANGVINLMGGIGGLLAFSLGAMLGQNVDLSFYVVAGVLLLVTLVFATLVRERRWALEWPNAEAAGPLGGPHPRPSLLTAWAAAGRVTREVLTSKDRSVSGLFWAIFFWSMGFQAVEIWFTTYATRALGVDAAAAAFSMAYSAAAILLMALPAGLLGKWLGRRATIRMGLVLLLAVLAAIWFSHDLGTVRPLLAGAGASWSLIIINAYPMVVDLVSPRDTGAYTGLYYLFSGVPAVLSPVLFGGLQDLLGETALFPGIVVAMLLAFLCFLLVKQGEASTTPSAAAR